LASEDRDYLRAIYHPDTVQFAALSGLNVDDWPSAHRSSRHAGALRLA
jgi:hypothetical protein